MLLESLKLIGVASQGPPSPAYSYPWGYMGKLSGPCSFLPVEQGLVDLLEKVCAHAGKKVTGVKTMVITSATFVVGVFNQKKKKKHEQMVVFCHEV